MIKESRVNVFQCSLRNRSVFQTKKLNLMSTNTELIPLANGYGVYG